MRGKRVGCRAAARWSHHPCASRRRAAGLKTADWSVRRRRETRSRSFHATSFRISRAIQYFCSHLITYGEITTLLRSCPNVRPGPVTRRRGRLAAMADCVLMRLRAAIARGACASLAPWFSGRHIRCRRGARRSFRYGVTRGHLWAAAGRSTPDVVGSRNELVWLVTSGAR